MGNPRPKDRTLESTCCDAGCSSFAWWICLPSADGSCFAGNSKLTAPARWTHCCSTCLFFWPRWCPPGGAH